VESFAEAELLEGAWLEDCALLVLPGGADLPYCRQLNGGGNRLIRRAPPPTPQPTCCREGQTAHVRPIKRSHPKHPPALDFHHSISLPLTCGAHAAERDRPRCLAPSGVLAVAARGGPRAIPAGHPGSPQAWWTACVHACMLTAACRCSRPAGQAEMLRCPQKPRICACLETAVPRQGFVEGGGAYLGLCAGAYYACRRVEFEVGSRRAPQPGALDSPGQPCVCTGSHAWAYPQSSRGR